MFTNLCVFRYDETEGQLVATELMPGATRDEVEAQTGFRVIFAPDLPEVTPPSPEELRALRTRIDPDRPAAAGIRELQGARHDPRRTCSPVTAPP